MKLLLLALLLLPLPTLAQHTLRLLVRDERSGQPLPGITVAVPAQHTGAATDSIGLALVPGLPAGPAVVLVSGLGYRSRSLRISLPQADNAPAIVEIEPNSLELRGVVVEATRTNSRIEDVPVRIEVIGPEEVEETITMRPANIATLLVEASGIQAQFTSASAASVAFRIQGLDGRYTQLLKDGFPLFGGLGQGLSLVQIPPLDLRQVEIIKGASSALYGGDAIAGLINLVSKKPTATPALTLLLNQTQKGGRDLDAFYSGRAGRLGLTLLATQNTQQVRDVDGDGFSDLPQVQLTTVNPRLYYYATDSTTLYAGLNATVETRAGGYLPALDDPTATPGYTERHRSARYSTQARLDTHLGRGRLLTVKNSVSAFGRDVLAGSAGAGGSTYFAGRQLSTYSEASLLLPHSRHRVVLGTTALTEAFTETSPATPGLRDYAYQTVGAFGQDDWRITPTLTLQAGLRADYQRPYGLFVLPRFSVLYKPAEFISLRAGGGLGYKAPTIFASTSEQQAYQHVLPLNPAQVQVETSRGLNADITLRGQLDEVSVSFNQAVFYTRLDHGLIPDPSLHAFGYTSYISSPAPIIAQGLETNLRVGVEELQFLAAYTLTDTRQTADPTQPAALPFVSRHRLVLTAVAEAEKNFRLGLEGFYTSPQYLGDGDRQGRAYWLFGVIGEKIFAPHFSVVLNVENLLDVRQTRFESVVTGPITQPVFRPLYAPLDGIVGNVALKVTL